MAKQITIKDIANQLQLHYSTVSRALNNDPKIHPDTREKVFNLAKELNYSKNAIAQSLESGKTNLIGVIVPEVSHWFFSAVISGIEESVNEKGYVAIVCQSSENFEKEQMHTETLASNRISGLLISVSKETTDSNHLQVFENKDIPVVLFDRVIEGLAADNVIVTDFEGAYMAVEHLISKGRKRIAYLAGPEGLKISQERLRGYKKALEDNGLVFDQNLVKTGGFNREDGYENTDKLLSDGEIPDAIFSINDHVALGAMRRIKEKEYKIPDDIAVVGFSDDPLGTIVEPKLTTVSQNPEEIGKVAAELLMDKILYNKTGEIVSKKLKTKLIVREST